MRLENLKIYFCNILTTPSEAQTKIGLTNEKKHQKTSKMLFSRGECYFEFGTRSGWIRIRSRDLRRPITDTWEHSLLVRPWTETRQDLSHCHHSEKNQIHTICIYIFFNSQYHKDQISSSIVPSRQYRKPIWVEFYIHNILKAAYSWHNDKMSWAHLLELFPIDHAVTVFVKLSKSRCYLLLAGSLWHSKRVINFQLLPSCSFAAILMLTQISLISSRPTVSQ